MDTIAMRTTPPQPYARWLPFGLALLALGGFFETGTENPLPDSTRIQMPDLRGVWKMTPTKSTAKFEASAAPIFVISGSPNDERGCMTVNMTAISEDGSIVPLDGPDKDMTWCAHRVAGLTIMELVRTDDDRPLPLEHFLLRQHRSSFRLCDIHDVLWDATPESARRKIETNEIITLSSDALAALIAEHATDIKRYASRSGECDEKVTRVIPRKI